MAVTEIKKTHIRANEGTELSATAVTGDFKVDLTGGDYKTCIMLIGNGSAANVTIKVGDGIGGVGEDLVVPVGADKFVPVVVDSSYFKMVSGEHKGFAVCRTTASIKVLVVELP